jgi:response regulator RpfG family c-di-GMP phosphodiesterase
MPKRNPDQSGPVVAVINTNDDLVQSLRKVLVDEGYYVVTGHIADLKSGRQDFSEFLNAHRPSAVIYDIAVPYEDNWTFLQTLLKLPETAEPIFVITTVNKRVLEERVGKTDAIEIKGGHADDFELIVEALAKRLNPSGSARR